MPKSNILIGALLAIMFIGFVHSKRNQTTTSKTVVVKNDPYHRNYVHNPPPHYNTYKSQYYN